ncbi:hypothetical protein H6G41_20945 [Tolypothrix sp. FACHB-123]|uniref:hypothetical protein n=1 Tax=Tolypothrix sp. FACHB-123 TaxID=2692868 RepID=UPI0016852BA3|nr:hypothetical protein [Tolypothrix sp. FACHB-123]MBD2357062.1 hypothetical protein [Tolypothrix sp. FACHB-123]
MIYFLGDYPIVTTDSNNFTTEIIYQDEFISSKIEKARIFPEVIPEAELSKKSENFIIPSVEEISPFYITQDTGTTNESTSQPVGQQPLQIEPISPEQKPFQPQRIPAAFRKKRASTVTSPGVSIQTPSAYGKSWGSASFGIGLQSRTRFTDTADGVVGFGIGLGDAQKSVGLDVSLGIVDLDNLQDASISFKLHRRLPEDFAVAFGVRNFVTFGDTDGGTSAYGVVTKMFRLQDSDTKSFSRLYVSVGIGGGQFRSESDINNKVDSIGVFGSVALRVAQPVNAIAEWTGQDLTLGLSITPFKNTPLVISPAVTDITGSAGDGTRFILGVGYGISF